MSKVKAFSHSVHRSAFYRELMTMFPQAGITQHKLPKNFWFRVPDIKLAHYDNPKFPNLRVMFEGTHCVVGDSSPTLEGKRRGTTRCFLICQCGKKVPIGRVNQHTHDEKFGTVQAVS